MRGRWKQHNHWLRWKIDHGLARHGRSVGPMEPSGWIAKLLYSVHFHKHDVEAVVESGPKVIKLTVGGTLGAVGEMNGE